MAASAGSFSFKSLIRSFALKFRTGLSISAFLGRSSFPSAVEMAPAANRTKNEIAAIENRFIGDSLQVDDRPEYGGLDSLLQTVLTVVTLPHLRQTVKWGPLPKSSCI